MEHAFDVIEIALVDGHARVPLLGEQLDHLLGSRVDRHADHDGARHHHFLGGPFGEVEEAVDELRRRNWLFADARFARENLFDLFERRRGRRVAGGGALAQEERVEQTQHETHERLRHGANEVGGPGQCQAPAQRIRHRQGARSQIEQQRERAREQSGEKLQGRARHRSARDSCAREHAVHPDRAGDRREGEERAARGPQGGGGRFRIALERQHPAHAPRRPAGRLQFVFADGDECRVRCLEQRARGERGARCDELDHDSISERTIKGAVETYPRGPYCPAPMKARVVVTLKRSVLDPQGQAVGRALASLGFSEVQGVRLGKIIELEIEEEDPRRARERLSAMCEKLLANPVIEEYRIEEPA